MNELFSPAVTNYQMTGMKGIDFKDQIKREFWKPDSFLKRITYLGTTSRTEA